MDRMQQMGVVTDILASMQTELLDKIANGAVPQNWDGIELRQWVAESFACKGSATVKVTNRYPMMAGQRLRDYQNDVVCRNL
jgi:hypothetical protein